LIEPIFELANVRFPAVLKDHAELHFGLSCGFDEGVGTRDADFDRFFRKDVEAMMGGGDALRCVQAGRAADDHQIHGAMLQEGVEILIALDAARLAAESGAARVAELEGQLVFQAAFPLALEPPCRSSLAIFRTSLRCGEWS